MIASVLARSSRPVISVPEDMTVAEAVKVMASRNVRRLVTTDAAGKVTGVFNAASLLGLASQGAELANATLAEAGLETPVYVSPEAPVIEAVRSMGRRRVTSVLVGPEGSPLGVFTTHDVVLELAASSYGSWPLSDVVIKGYPTVSPSSPLAEAARTMASAGSTGALVMDGDSLVGVLSVREVVLAMADGDFELATPVSRASVVPLAYVDLGATVSEAARTMSAKGVDVAAVFCGRRPCGAVDDLALTYWLSSR